MIMYLSDTFFEYEKAYCPWAQEYLNPALLDLQDAVSVAFVVLTC